MSGLANWKRKREEAQDSGSKRPCPDVPQRYALPSTWGLLSRPLGWLWGAADTTKPAALQEMRTAEVQTEVCGEAEAVASDASTAGQLPLGFTLHTLTHVPAASLQAKEQEKEEAQRRAKQSEQKCAESEQKCAEAEASVRSLKEQMSRMEREHVLELARLTISQEQFLQNEQALVEEKRAKHQAHSRTSALKKELAQSQATVTSKQDEIKRLQSAAEQSERALKVVPKLKSHIQQLQTQLAAKSQTERLPSSPSWVAALKSEDKSREAHKVHHDIEKLKADLQRQRKALQLKDNNVQQLEEELDRQRHGMNVLKQQVRQADEKEIQLQKLEAEHTALWDSLQSKTKEVQELLQLVARSSKGSEHVNSLQEQVCALQTEVAEQSKCSADATARLRQMEEERQESDRQREAMEITIGQLQKVATKEEEARQKVTGESAQLSGLQEEVQLLQSRLAEQSAQQAVQVQQLEAEKEEEAQTVRRLEAERAVHVAKLGQLETESEEKSARLEKVESEKKEQIRHLTAEKEEGLVRLQQMEADTEKRRGQVEQLEAEKEEVSRQLQQLQVEKEEGAAQIRHLKAEKEEQFKKVVDANQVKEDALQHLKQLQAQRNEEHAGAMHSRLQEMQAAGEHMQSQLETKEAELQELRSAQSETQQTVQNLQIQLAEADASKTKTALEIAALKVQLENAHSALHSKEQAQLQRQQSHHEDSGTAPDVAQLKAEVNQLRGELQRKEQESLRLRPPEEQKPRGMSPDGIGMHGKVDTTRLQSILKSFHEVSAGPRPAMIIDSGSSVCRVGLAGQSIPTCVFPSIVGRPRAGNQALQMLGTAHGEICVGAEAQRKRGVLALRHPVQQGIVRDWGDMESVWRHAFSEVGVSPQDTAVLLTEPAHNPLGNRETSVEILFEKFAVPALYMGVQGTLAMLGHGTTSGIVVDSGDGLTQVTPVYGGHTLKYASRRMNLAGADLTAYLQTLLTEQGNYFSSTAEMELVREIKESMCYTALNYSEELAAIKTPDREYELPDGRQLNLGAECIKCPELMFQPSLAGKPVSGIHETVASCIEQLDPDMQGCMWGSVLLSGGTTMCKGFAERMQAELQRQATGPVSVLAPEDRQNLVWKGGAVLASTGNDMKLWFPKEAYDECGPAVVHRLFF